MALADWVLQDHTYHSDKLHILYGGFNPRWAAGRLERQVADKIGQQYLDQHLTKTVHVVIPNWYEPADVAEHVRNVDADVIVLCSLADPLNYSIIDILPQKEIYFAGYTTTGLSIDFWAVACLQNFRQYTEEELQPTTPKLFLNYNRKPHPHRVELVDSLEQAGLIDYGYVTLDGRYTVKDTVDDFAEHGALESVNSYSIPNDIYSLGQMNIWQQHFINVVSETVAPNETVFLSEKIYKPIIGMRPFIINGSYEIYSWLKAAGFDCFEDLFSRNIVESLLQYKDQDLLAVYESIKPRLQYNRRRFFEYAAKQL